MFQKSINLIYLKIKILVLLERNKKFIIYIQGGPLV